MAQFNLANPSGKRDKNYQLTQQTYIFYIKLPFLQEKKVSSLKVRWLTLNSQFYRKYAHVKQEKKSSFALEIMQINFLFIKITTKSNHLKRTSKWKFFSIYI